MMLIATESQLRECVELDADGLAAVEDGFARLDRGEADIPTIMGLEIPAKNGAADVKAAYVEGWDGFAIKISTRFFDNPERGLPSGSGMMTLFDSDTGQPRAVLPDNGYLTTVRTALAGALAAKYLARERLGTVAVIGAGSQARWQVEALALVRDFERVRVYSRDAGRAQAYVDDMAERLGKPVEAADSAEASVRGADVVITTTPAREPVVYADWLESGAHVTAMGSDAAHKNELEPAVLARADVLVCDLESQCRVRGELHHALQADALNSSNQVRELGTIVNGRIAGRENDAQISVCDLTGVGVQDTAIARLAVSRLEAAGLGQQAG